MRGLLDAECATLYICSQLLGAIGGGCCYMYILDATFALHPGVGYTLAAAALVEVIFTSALVFVVLSVATTEQDEGSWYTGLAIGFVVISGAFAIGPISGCSLNPAITWGTMLSHLMHTGHLHVLHFLVYTASPFIGALIAVMFFRIIRNEEYTHPLGRGRPQADISPPDSARPVDPRADYEKSVNRVHYGSV